MLRVQNMITIVIDDLLIFLLIFTHDYCYYYLSV